MPATDRPVAPRRSYLSPTLVSPNPATALRSPCRCALTMAMTGLSRLSSSPPEEAVVELEVGRVLAEVRDAQSAAASWTDCSIRNGTDPVP